MIFIKEWLVLIFGVFIQSKSAEVQHFSYLAQPEIIFFFFALTPIFLLTAAHNTGTHTLQHFYNLAKLWRCLLYEFQVPSILDPERVRLLTVTESSGLVSNLLVEVSLTHGCLFIWMFYLIQKTQSFMILCFLRAQFCILLYWHTGCVQSCFLL